MSRITSGTRAQLEMFVERKMQEPISATDLAQKIRVEFSTWPDNQAAHHAQAEVIKVYNFATLAAGEVAGIKKVQLVDSNSCGPCRERNGKIIDIAQAFDENTGEHECTLSIRLLPQSSIEVRRVALDGGLGARYDEETDTILLSPKLDHEEETKYMLAIGQSLESRQLVREAPTNGKPTEEIELIA